MLRCICLKGGRLCPNGCRLSDCLSGWGSAFLISLYDAAKCALPISCAFKVISNFRARYKIENMLISTI